MKKSLIALAALSAFATAAQAQSSVTVYGLIDIGLTNAKTDTVATSGGAVSTAKLSTTGNGHGGLATSRLGFRGTEDLGGGLKANFQIEYALAEVGTGAALSGARYSWAGLEDSKLGQLRLGQQENSVHSVMGMGAAGGLNNAVGALYTTTSDNVSGTANNAGVRPYTVFVPRAVTYIAPKIAGFTFELQTANFRADTEPTASIADTQAKSNAASVKYSIGKLNLAYGQTKTRTDSSALNNQIDGRESQVLAANYDFGVVRAFALRTTDKNTNASGLLRDIKVTEVGLQMPVGKTVFFASTYDGKRDGTATGTTMTGASANASSDVNGYQVGAIHNLSKRTAAYAIVGQQEIKGKGDAAGRSVESTGTYVGVRHSF